MPIEMLRSSFNPIAAGCLLRLGGLRHGEIITVMTKKTTVNETVEKRS
jgi:hypothetical protein